MYIHPYRETCNLLRHRKGAARHGPQGHREQPEAADAGEMPSACNIQAFARHG